MDATPPSRRMLDRHLWQIRPVRDLLWIALLLFVLWLGYYLRSIFTPVLIALFLAYLFAPLIAWAQRRLRFPRSATAGVLLVAMLIVSVGAAAWLGPMFIQQLVALAKAIPTYLNNFAMRYEIDLGTFRTDVQTWADAVQKDPTGSIVGGVGFVLAGTSQAVTVIGTVIGASAYVAMVLVLVPVFFFYFAWRFDALVRNLAEFIPASSRGRALDMIHRMDQMVAVFFRARVVIALLVGAMLSLGWFATGVPYWFLLGMATGLLTVVPYATFIGWPIALLLKWLDATSAAPTGAIDWYASALWPSVVFLIVQAAEGFVLTPVIQGKALNLSVVTVLLAVLVGGALGGLYGLILAIPITACLKIILVEVLAPRLRTWAAEN